MVPIIIIITRYTHAGKPRATICNVIENTCKQKQNGHTLMVGWEKTVTRYNKNNKNKNNNKNLHCHKECKECNARICTYVCWRLRIAKCEREEEFEVSKVAPLQPLSHQPSPMVACTLHCQYSATLYNDLYQYQYYYCTVMYNDIYQAFQIDIIIIYIYIYLHTLAQIRPPLLQDYLPHAKALSNNMEYGIPIYRY